MTWLLFDSKDFQSGGLSTTVYLFNPDRSVNKHLKAFKKINNKNTEQISRIINKDEVPVVSVCVRAGDSDSMPNFDRFSDTAP